MQILLEDPLVLVFRGCLGSDSNKQTWFAALGMFVILSCLNYIEKYAYTVLQNLYRIFFSSIVSMSGSA